MNAPFILFQGRAGFEKEIAQEVMVAAAKEGCEGFVKAKPDSGFAVFHAHQEEMGIALGAQLDYTHLVFPRQMVRVGEMLTALPEADRATPIAQAASALGNRFAALCIEMPDTNDGKSLAQLAKPLTPHLEKALRKAGVVFDDASAQERLHVFFVGGRACYVGVSNVANSSRWPMGIPRLRMPSGSPSRSTNKLAEAILEFLPGRQFEPGTAAADLGAAPGGWTWQLVQRGFMVTAVDNAAMDPALMESGQVKHRRDDGFHYQPADPFAWMVCDMVESPSRIATLVARWIEKGWCQECIFNLKLPMKKRWEELQRCRGIIDEALGGRGYYLRFKHLYHDREEVTGYLARRAGQPLHSAP